jgi:hypothetical protein
MLFFSFANGKFRYLDRIPDVNVACEACRVVLSDMQARLFLRCDLMVALQIVA